MVPLYGRGASSASKFEVKKPSQLDLAIPQRPPALGTNVVLGTATSLTSDPNQYLVAFIKSSSFKAHCCSIATASKADVNAPKYSASRCRNLFSRISHVGDGRDIVQALDQWVVEGGKVHHREILRIIRDLRSRKRFSQALQISEWVSSNKAFTFSPGDRAVHLDLVGVVRGSEAAERFFDNLSEQGKDEKAYGALLSCYARERLSIKALAHMEKMKQKGYASSSLAYNNLMALYEKTGELEKIPEVLSEMKSDGVAPNNFSYKMCIKALGERSDIIGMEKLLKEVESQPDISIDWTTYSIVAYQFIKANDKENALTYMKKLEEKNHGDAMGYNHLISLYAHLGDKDEMMRLWVSQKITCKKQINRDYITMISSLVKLDDAETAEALLKDWDSSCLNYDFRVPNILLIWYCQKGLVEKAELMLHDIMHKGKKPTPNSWSIVSTGYLNINNMAKAFECMKEALSVVETNMKWIPKPAQITSLLEWLGDNGEFEQVEAFVQSLRALIPVSKHMYDAIIKANTRVGGDSRWILDRMETDNIEIDEETRKLLSSAVMVTKG
ncbi:pentatricopeptide repeat-containing protein mitochondrial [Dorcoceras hygrometricum]|uniref:Pentatricopeptide repeat-containing protein mitochondrial n=1 Tax=Dorcoceras hygrometricum TaxID=472368 RepID=A0A2Z7AN58_9LAMI|nr:pentatricopeptide repeat-containing protein mitochondrial [Dorcoceras hygrometricum]